MKSSLQSVSYGDACLSQTAVQVQHSDQSGPAAAPVSNRQNRTSMMEKSSQHVMGVLPDGFDHDDRGLRWNLAENVDAVALAVDKAVLLFGLERVCAFYVASQFLHGVDESLLDRLLRGPAHLVGGQAQVTTGDQEIRTRHLGPHSECGAVYNARRYYSNSNVTI